MSKIQANSMLKRLATSFLPVHGAKTPQTQHMSFKNVLAVLAQNRVLNPTAHSMP